MDNIVENFEVVADNKCLKEYVLSYSLEEFNSFYSNEKKTLEKELLRHGALLFRGLAIKNVEDFSKILSSFNEDYLDYVEGNSPRSKLHTKIYNSTEYDSKFDITLHNEMSYSLNWPKKLYFCCDIAAEKGGETTLADSRLILNKIDKNIIDEFEQKQIKYIRNLHSGKGFGRSWQNTFESKDKDYVEKHCKENGIDFKWNSDGSIKLTEIRPATRIHPITNEKVWFNQVDQFHPYQYSKDIFETLLFMNDNDYEKLPIYATYGDGTEIERSVIEEIITTIKKESIKINWQKGDLLVIDNMLVCHGRKSYSGPRRILVAMC